MEFRWNAWNLDHATKHGISPEEAESVVRRGARGYPRQVGNDKLLVEGRGTGDRFVRVVFSLDDDGTIYVIHAMPLSRRKHGRRRGR